MISVRKRSRKNNLRFPFPRGRSGSVLILVVWMMALLGFGVFYLGSAGAFSLGVMQRFEKNIHAYALARTAVPLVQQKLAEDSTEHDSLNEPFFLPAQYEAQTLNGGTFSVFYIFPNRFTGYPEKIYGIIDEDRKLNLNTASAEILANLFRDVGKLNPKDLNAAESLAAAIADWRDEDSQETDYGAERIDYLNMKDSYECKNAPFESVEELLLIKGITPQIFERVRPFLTVYGSGKLNLNTAPAQVLQAAGLGEPSINGIMLYRAGEDSENGTEDDPVLATIDAVQGELAVFVTAEDMNKIARLVKSDWIGVRSEAYSFSSEAMIDENEYAYKIDVVMKKDGEILYWRED